MFGRVNHTTSADVDKVTRGYERLGLTQEQVKSAISGLNGQIEKSFVEGKGGTPEWMRAYGISATDRDKNPRATDAVLQEIVLNYLRRQQQIRTLQTQESEAKKQGNSNDIQDLADRRSALEIENRKLIKDAGFSQEFLGTLMGVKSLGEFSAAFYQGANDRPGMTPLDESNFEKLNKAIMEAQTKLGALGDVVLRLATPVLTSSLEGLNRFLDKIIRAARAFGYVNKSEDDAELKRANQARARRLAENAPRGTPGLDAALRAGAELQKQGYGSTRFSEMLPSTKDSLAIAYAAYKDIATTLRDEAATREATYPGSIDRNAEVLKQAGDNIVKLYDALTAEGNAAGRNPLQKAADYLRSLQPQHSGIEMLIKMINAGGLRPDINVNHTVPAVYVYQTVTGATAPGAAGAAVANALKNNPSAVDINKALNTSTSGVTAR